MGDFVTPEPHRITLSGGQTVDIARRLSHGESEDMYARMLANRAETRTAKLLAYILGWSLTRDEKPVAYSLALPEQARLDTLRALDPDLAVEIHEAIESHETAEAKRRTARKNGQGGTPESASISPSPSGADGALTGSAV